MACAGTRRPGAAARRVNIAWHINTGRLHLRPVSSGDLRGLEQLKGDPTTYAQMLGGIRTPVQVAEELAADTQVPGRPAASGCGSSTPRRVGPRWG